VKLQLTAHDDVAAAGDNVTADGATGDHFFLAGDDISFLNSTVHDLFAAGADIDLVSGEVSDDVIAAGGRIRVAHDARVNGDVIVAGGDIRLDGPIGGEVRAAGRKIYIDGVVTGDVYVDGQTITIGPDAHIQGAFTHRGRSVTISQQAQIDGRTIARTPRPEIDMRPLRALGVWAGASALFGLMLLAIIIAVAFPRLMNDSAQSLRERPLSMLGLGLAIAILTPMLCVILFVTLIGMPLAFVVGLAFALLWPLALAGAAYGASMWIRVRRNADAPAPSAGARALWAGLGAIVLILIGLLPVIGMLAWWLAYFVGLGAVTLQMGRALSRPTAPAAV
jgi:cytoskeletal protein CcmA (bactofilin family)